MDLKTANLPACRKASGDRRLGKLLGALERLYAVKDIKAFPLELMAVTDELIPCTNVSFDVVDSVDGAVEHRFLRPTELSHEEFMQRWQVFCHEHPGIAFLENGGKVTHFALSDFVTQRQLSQMGVYREVLRPVASDYQIGVILPVVGCVVGMAIGRDCAFSDEEREIVELLHPHFVQAFKNAQLFSGLRKPTEVDFRAWRNRGLTQRECEVLQWLVEGKRNSEIAVILAAKTRTVGKHVENIFAKLGVETRSAAAAEARRLQDDDAVPKFGLVAVNAGHEA